MEKVSLKWDDFRTNVTKSFSSLRKEQDFCDVTLMSDDNKTFSAHKVVLSASSDLFKSILRKADHPMPMIYLNGVASKELYHILDYIYEGDVQMFQEDLKSFLCVAHKLKIYGLNDITDDSYNKKLCNSAATSCTVQGKCTEPVKMDLPGPAPPGQPVPGPDRIKEETQTRSESTIDEGSYEEGDSIGPPVETPDDTEDISKVSLEFLRTGT